MKNFVAGLNYLILQKEKKKNSILKITKFELKLIFSIYLFSTCNKKKEQEPISVVQMLR